VMKDWPRDAVMIVASIAGEERGDQMELAASRSCRDCGAKLMADTHTIRRAENLPSRRGRPILFFCVACAVQYERPSELHDDRNRNRN